MTEEVNDVSKLNFSLGREISIDDKYDWDQG